MKQEASVPWPWRIPPSRFFGHRVNEIGRRPAFQGIQNKNKHCKGRVKMTSYRYDNGYNYRTINRGLLAEVFQEHAKEVGLSTDRLEHVDNEISYLGHRYTKPSESEHTVEMWKTEDPLEAAVCDAVLMALVETYLDTHGFKAHPDYEKAIGYDDILWAEWEYQEGYPWARDQIREQLDVETLLADVRQLLME